MEAVAQSWLFAVFMGVIVLMLIFWGIKDLRERRRNSKNQIPKNSQNKYLGRILILDLIKSIFRIEKTYKDDNPMTHQEKDDDLI